MPIVVKPICLHFRGSFISCISQNYTTARVGKDLWRSTWSNTLLGAVSYNRFLRLLSRQVLMISRDADSTNSDRLFQCLTSHSKRGFFMFNGISCISLGAHYLLPYTGHPWNELGPICFNPSYSGFWTHWFFSSWGSIISPLSLSKAHTKVCLMLQYFNQFSDSLLDSLQYAHISLVQGDAKLGTTLTVVSPQLNKEEGCPLSICWQHTL